MADSLLRAAPAPVAVTNARGVLVETNPAWERLAGRAAAESADWAALHALLAEYGCVEDHPLRLSRGGRAVELLVSGQAVDIAGERRHVLSCSDAGEPARREKALRELEEANRQLESYNYSLSHDLRQPLAAISGFADLLLEQGEAGSDSLTQTCAREIEAAAARMSQIIESLRRLADSTRGSLRIIEVDVAEQIAGVLDELSVAGPVEAVKLGSLPRVHADATLLRQVWTNLIHNALKYTRHSSHPRVEVSGERRHGAVDYTVRDNGIGFDMNDAPRIFTAFQRLAPTDGFEGHGIGLAIVERIVRRHGGKIVAESAPGEGATFRITLPDPAAPA